MCSTRWLNWYLIKASRFARGNWLTRLSSTHQFVFDKSLFVSQAELAESVRFRRTVTMHSVNYNHYHIHVTTPLTFYRPFDLRPLNCLWWSSASAGTFRTARRRQLCLALASPKHQNDCGEMQKKECYVATFPSFETDLTACTTLTRLWMETWLLIWTVGQLRYWLEDMKNPPNLIASKESYHVHHSTWSSLWRIPWTSPTHIELK